MKKTCRKNIYTYTNKKLKSILKYAYYNNVVGLDLFIEQRQWYCQKA